MPTIFDEPNDGLPQTTARGIYYEVLSLSPREQWGAGANQTRVEVRVRGDDAWDFVTDMVGTVRALPGFLERHLPEANPFDEKQFCTRVDQIDQGGNPDEPGSAPAADFLSGWPLPGWIRYACTFEGLPYKVRSDYDVIMANAATTPPAIGVSEIELRRYVIRRLRPQAREQQFPGGAFRIMAADPADRTRLMQTGFKVLPFADVEYTWVRVPVANLPLDAWKARLGTVNVFKFDYAPGEGYAFDAEQLLFVGWDDTNRYWDANEDWVCDVVLNFRANYGGWNRFLNNRAELVRATLDGTSTGALPYAREAFHHLFIPAV